MSKKGFLKESALSGIATIVRIVASFVTNKFLASIAGPAGFAVIGQLQNLISVGQGTSSLALQNGWVSLTARYKNREKELGPIWRGGFRLSVYASIASAIFFVLFAFVAPLEKWFPGVPLRYMQAAILFAIPGFVALTVSMISSAVMNGLSDYRRWAAITIGSSVLNCLWVVLMIQTKSLSVLGAVATQSVLSCFYALFLAWKGGFKYKRFSARLKPNFKIWRGYALMGIVPMVASPVLYFLVRSFLGRSFGWDVAGYWQGATRISDFFNVGFSSILGIVLLPRLAACSSADGFHRTLKRLLACVLSLAFAATLLMFLFREWIVVLALSRDFLPLSDLISVQFVGDFFKAGCWCLGMALVARKETVAFLSVELGSEVLFVALTVAFGNLVGYHAPFIAYAVENFACLLALAIVLRRLPWKSL